MKENSSKRDYVWNTIGVFAQNAISPLLLVAVTRINGIFDSGLFSFAFSVAIIFWVVSMWGGRTYQVSDVNREFSHHSYVMVRLILAVFVTISAVIFVTLNQYALDKSGIIIALVIFKIFESIADALYGILQVNHKLYLTGRSLTYKAVGGFSLFVIIDILTHNILLSCLGIVVANIILIVFYDLRIIRNLSSTAILPRLTGRVIKNAFHIMGRTWPILVVIFLSMFALNIPRYFVDLYHQDQIGYFGILAMPITLIGIMMTFILQPKVVHLAKLYETKRYSTFNSIVNKLILVTIGLGLVILIASYLVGIPVLELVFGIDFSKYLLPLLIIVIGGIVNAIVSIFINIFIIIRSFKSQFYILLFTNILLAIFSTGFVKQYGLEGGVALFALINFVQAGLFITTYKMILARATDVSN